MGLLGCELLAAADPGSLFRYYSALQPGRQWAAEFATAFGRSIDAFYQDFEAWRGQGFPPI